MLVLLWVGICFPGLSQQVFNRVYDFGFPRNQLHKMIIHNDTIVGYGRAYSNDPPYKQCLFVARFDSNGIVLDHNLICDSLGGHFTMAINWSEIVVTSDGGYALTASAFDRHDGLFVKLRADLSVEFLQEYRDTINFVEFYNTIVEHSDGYLLGGYVQTPNYLIRPFLRRVDKQGFSAWFSYYGDYNVTDLFSNYCRLNDSIVAFVGGYVNNPNIASSRGPWIILINSNNSTVQRMATFKLPNWYCSLLKSDW